MHTQQIAELTTEGFRETSPHYGNVALNLVDDISKERAIESAAEVRRRVIEEGKSKHAPGGLLLRIAMERLRSRQKLRVLGRRATTIRVTRPSPCSRTTGWSGRPAKQDAEAAGQPQRNRDGRRDRRPRPVRWPGGEPKAGAARQVGGPLAFSLQAGWRKPMDGYGRGCTIV